jgi:WD40 repeat protein
MAGLTVSRLELWDVEDERPAAVLPGFFTGACFDPTGGDLFTTQSAEGLRRWPVRVGAAGAVEVGPPEDLGVRPDPTAPLGNPITARGGRVIVTATTPTELAVLDRDRAGGKPWNIPGVLAEWPALSRDGRWLACIALGGTGVALWDLEGRRKVRDFPALGRVRLAFSPDGKRLAVSGPTGCLLYDLTTSDPPRVIEYEIPVKPVGPVAFSPDGRALAVMTAPETVRLVDPDTLEELATLVDAYRGDVCFSPDGGRLAMAGEVGILVWNLTLARQALRDAGLDWAEAAPAPPGRPGPLTVHVVP